MIYKSFTIKNFKGISEVSLSLVKNDLVLLLGLNESGKTSILKAIEAFDFLNDPSSAPKHPFFRSIRKKKDVQSNKSAIITAALKLDQKLKIDHFKKFVAENKLSPEHKSLIEAFLIELNRKEFVLISRVFPFKNGNPQPYFYKFEIEHPFANDQVSYLLAKEIIRIAPFIIYFEDFKDRIPERIYVNPQSDSYNEDWYDIIDGLFYNTDNDFSIKEFKKLYASSNKREDDAKTVLKKVNKTLNRSFSEKWKELSGVKDIDETVLSFDQTKKCFEIKVVDDDGTTYSVDERSKGALWYLSFLMKTEFRRKKLRKASGKPIFLIDEPASNLHSTAQTNMIEDFQKLVEDTSVIYTTHSQYLVSTGNIKNTYVVKRDSGEISCVPWVEYIKSESPEVSYYQPLANLLNIIPNNFTIPWEKAIITEGPSDMHVLSVMYQALNNSLPEFVIYPGTSAFDLSNLISFNIGWGSKFRVLMDSDKHAGIAMQKKYIDEFSLNDSIIQVLPFLGKKIEDMFDKGEKVKLYALAFDTNPPSQVSKKEFASTFALLFSTKSKVKKVKDCLTEFSIKNFMKIFENLNLAGVKSNEISEAKSQMKATN